MVQDILRSGRWRPAAYLDSDPCGSKRGACRLWAICDRPCITAGRSDAGRGGYRPQSDTGRHRQPTCGAASSSCPPFTRWSAFRRPHRGRSRDHRSVSICVHARIGAHVVSAGSIIEHDNFIGRGVFLHPAVRLAGTVIVEDLATLGIGACVIPGRRIGRGALVQPGAVIIADVAPGAMVAGVPGNERSASRFVSESIPGQLLTT